MESDVEQHGRPDVINQILTIVLLLCIMALFTLGNGCYWTGRMEGTDGLTKFGKRVMLTVGPLTLILMLSL